MKAQQSQNDKSDGQLPGDGTDIGLKSLSEKLTLQVMRSEICTGSIFHLEYH